MSDINLWDPQGQPFSTAEENVDDFISKGYKVATPEEVSAYTSKSPVNLVSPDYKPTNLSDAGSLGEFIQRGYRLPTKQEEETGEVYNPQTDPLAPLKVIAEQAASGASFGLSEVAQNKIAGNINTKDRQAEYPILSTASNIGGAVAPVIADAVLGATAGSIAGPAGAAVGGVAGAALGGGAVVKAITRIAKLAPTTWFNRASEYLLSGALKLAPEASAIAKPAIASAIRSAEASTDYVVRKLSNEFSDPNRVPQNITKFAENLLHDPSLYISAAAGGASGLVGQKLAGKSSKSSIKDVVDDATHADTIVYDEGKTVFDNGITPTIPAPPSIPKQANIPKEFAQIQSSAQRALYNIDEIEADPFIGQELAEVRKSNTKTLLQNQQDKIRANYNIADDADIIDNSLDSNWTPASVQVDDKLKTLNFNQYKDQAVLALNNRWKELRPVYDDLVNPSYETAVERAKRLLQDDYDNGFTPDDFAANRMSYTLHDLQSRFDNLASNVTKSNKQAFENLSGQVDTIRRKFELPDVSESRPHLRVSPDALSDIHVRLGQLSKDLKNSPFVGSDELLDSISLLRRDEQLFGIPLTESTIVRDVVEDELQKILPDFNQSFLTLDGLIDTNKVAKFYARIGDVESRTDLEKFVLGLNRANDAVEYLAIGAQSAQKTIMEEAKRFRGFVDDTIDDIRALNGLKTRDLPKDTFGDVIVDKAGDIVKYSIRAASTSVGYIVGGPAGAFAGNMVGEVVGNKASDYVRKTIAPEIAKHKDMVAVAKVLRDVATSGIQKSVKDASFVTPYVVPPALLNMQINNDLANKHFRALKSKSPDLAQAVQETFDQKLARLKEVQSSWSEREKNLYIGAMSQPKIAFTRVALGQATPYEILALKEQREDYIEDFIAQIQQEREKLISQGYSLPKNSKTQLNLLTSKLPKTKPSSQKPESKMAGLNPPKRPWKMDPDDLLSRADKLSTSND